MRGLRTSGVAVAVLLAQAGLARAEGPTIEHSAIKCLVQGKYRKMPARFAPPEVAQPRVYFRPEGIPSWYYVEMKPEAALGHVGVLPKPTKKLVGKHIEYYLEAASRDFDTGRTPEYDPIVVAKDSECSNDPVVALYSNEPPSAVFPSVPEGFAIGGGVAGGTVAAVVGGAAVVAGGAYLLTKDDEPEGVPGTQPPVTNPPITTLPPPTTLPPASGAVVACQADPRQGRAPLLVKFSAQASGGNGVFDYAWTFGDGGTSTQVNPSHTYTTPGLYEARVVATSGSATDTCARTVLVLANSFRLDVSTAGTGTGRVTGPGIDCPGDCSEEYEPGTLVTLAAQATGGSTFAGWSGDCSGAGACEVPMIVRDRSVTATFTAPPATFALNVSVGGNGTGTVTGPGINCPGDCSEIYSAGTPVALTAAPTGGSTFGGWGGDCAGTTTCNLTMNGPHTVSATFNPPTLFPLTVTVGGNGTGTVTGPGITCGTDCTEPYTAGTMVTLTAAPGAGSSFGGWAGCDAVTGLTCNVTMSAARTVSATFTVLPTFRLMLTVTNGGGGSGRVQIVGTTVPDCASSPPPGTTCTTNWPPNTTLTLRPIVTTGFFINWGGACAPPAAQQGSNDCILVMSQDRTVTALFDNPSQPPSGQASLVSRIEGTSGRAQILANGVLLGSPGQGVQTFPLSVANGENRLEAQLLDTGKAGTWRFELSGVPGLERGSLRVLAGQAIAVGPDSVVFRISGRAGERFGLAFTAR